MATITVDGRAFDAPAGAPLVEVMKKNGVYISNLCYIDGLKPYAGCRSCLVDIQGPPGLQLSYTAQVQDGMVVTTNSDECKEARKAVVAIILANHSDRCLTCHRREHCQRCQRMRRRGRRGRHVGAGDCLAASVFRVPGSYLRS